MDSLFWAFVAPPASAGVALSFLQELQLQPRPWPFWRRGARAFAAHVGVWLALYCAELALFRRPWLAAANVCVVFYVFVLISNAKQHSLREPFLYQDFDYCRDMIHHPRLYLPFLGISRALLGLGAIFGALYLGLRAEPSMLTAMTVFDFVIGTAILAATAGVLLLWAAVLTRALTFEPEADVRRLGFLPYLFAYGIAERPVPDVLPVIRSSRRAVAGAGSTPANLPDVVVVQSESFFDARRHFPIVRREILPHYDEILKSALHHGPLHVPAWGANTVRTEFAFLAGVNASALGVHRFNPYRHLIPEPFTTIATRLKALGYKTRCVHPYPASFYRRDRVFPLLGFDEFLDIGAFDSKSLAGAYVGDAALAEKVCACLDPGGAQPSFVFVITMENHGPLHWEPPAPETDSQLYLDEPPQGSSDLSAYLRHLVNADSMIARLRAHIEARARGGWLCWYGDHVPIMPGVYRAMGYPDGTTDYFIWQKGAVPGVRAPRALAADELAKQLLQATQIAV